MIIAAWKIFLLATPAVAAVPCVTENKGRESDVVILPTPAELRGSQINVQTPRNVVPIGNNQTITPVSRGLKRINDRKGYFNYDPGNKKYGPEAWGDFDKDEIEHLPDYKYFKKYERELATELTKGLKYNYCSSSRYKNDQSPIDLRVEDINTECYEYHQLREKV